jgi:2-polyprenyl-6-methoxyphenol hydroxylase-like FAD-dependent oxidoreductase
MHVILIIPESGGMGLTGGIADVGSLYESLVGIHTGQADDSILDVYDEVRRRIWATIINPISTDNMRRLFQYSDPDEAMEKDPFFKMIKEMQERPAGAEAATKVSCPIHYTGGLLTFATAWSTVVAI